MARGHPVTRPVSAHRPREPVSPLLSFLPPPPPLSSHPWTTLLSDLCPTPRRLPRLLSLSAPCPCPAVPSARIQYVCSGFRPSGRGEGISAWPRGVPWSRDTRSLAGDRGLRVRASEAMTVPAAASAASLALLALLAPLAVPGVVGAARLAACGCVCRLHGRQAPPQVQSPEHRSSRAPSRRAAEGLHLLPEAPPRAPTPPSPRTRKRAVGRLPGAWPVPARATLSQALWDPGCGSPAYHSSTPPPGACANGLLGFLVRPPGLRPVPAQPAFPPLGPGRPPGLPRL